MVPDDSSRFDERKIKINVDTNESIAHSASVSGKQPNDTTNKTMTTEQIKALPKSEFWDIFETLAEEESQSQEDVKDVTELRIFQKEADRRSEGARKAFAASHTAGWAAKAANDPCPF